MHLSGIFLPCFEQLPISACMLPFFSQCIHNYKLLMHWDRMDLMPCSPQTLSVRTEVGESALED